MRYLYMRLENYIGILNGSGKEVIEIDFSSSSNKIILISGCNGSGKSTLINAINLLPDGSESFVPLKSASKYLRLTDGINVYEITFSHPVDKHGCRAVTKVSLLKNGMELNPSGNVSSYKDTIFNELDIDSNFLSLSTVSTNNRGLADKKPAERKKIISSLISSLEVYNDIYKNLNKKANIFKSYVNNLTGKIQSAGDETLLMDNLNSLKNKEQSLLGLIESSKEKIIEFRTLLAVNDKDGSLQQKYDDLMNNINQYEKSKDLAYHQLVKFSDDNSKVCNFNDVAKDINSNNSLLASYSKDLQDNTSKNEAIIININSLTSDIDGLNVKIDKLSENVDETLEQSIQTYTDKITEIVDGFNKIGIEESNIELLSPDDISRVIEIYNIILSHIDKLYELSSSEDLKILMKNPQEEYNSLIEEENNLKNKVSELASKSVILEHDKSLVGVLEQRPSTCTDDNCSFVKSAIDISNSYGGVKLLNKEYDKIIKELNKSQQQLEDIQLNKIPHMKHILSLYEYISRVISIVNENRKLLSLFKISSILLDTDSLLEKICIMEYRFNELRDINSYLDWSNSVIVYKSANKILTSLKTKYEIQQNNISMLNDFKHELSNKESKLSRFKDEYNRIEKDIEFLNEMISRVTEKINILNQYNELYSNWKQAEDTYNNAVTESDKIKETFKSSLSILESINQLDECIRHSTDELVPIQEQIKNIDTQLTLISSFKEEYEMYKEKYDYVTILRNYSSPTTGSIQSLYMSIYMDKTLDMVNQLLSMLFSGQYHILQYIINENEFRIPFIGNGMTVDDISSGSTSQVCMMGMIINLVLANMCSSKYNIVALDEIDSGLDNYNKYMFIDVLNKISEILNIDQIFVISHSIESSLSNIDVILTSDSQEYRDLFADSNIIYHN